MKSIPIVALYCELNESYINRDNNDVFPTLQKKKKTS